MRKSYVKLSQMQRAYFLKLNKYKNEKSNNCNSFLISTSAFAQFNLSSGIGYGIQVNSKFDYTLFQTTVSVEPQFQFDKFSLVSQSLAMISDSAK